MNFFCKDAFSNSGINKVAMVKNAFLLMSLERRLVFKHTPKPDFLISKANTRDFMVGDMQKYFGTKFD